jgi:hypothetical protein
VSKWLVIEVLGSARTEVLPSANLGGLVDVIERRHDATKAVSAKQLFGVETSIGFSELDMVLFRKFSESVVSHLLLSVEVCWNSTKF